VVPDDLSQHTQEILESKWCGFTRRDQTIPGRSISGLQIQRDIERLAVGFEGKGWGIVRADGGEFILPDTFGGLTVVPVTPAICLVCGHEDSVISRSAICDLNRRALQSAKQYVIARDFTNSPL
jgi:hypothetical protein